jgi:hypothetical protein
MKKIIPLLVLGIGFRANASVIAVPGDFSSVQSAINAAVDGDTVAVSPGTYYENINFRGKRILLTSLYYLASDTTYISSTVINGSAPANPDTASCVIFNSGEDSTSILQGFTITGGAGTKWLDIHGAGTFREGGGVIIELCSPTVRCNFIRDNSATDVTGVSGAGGGGIRIGDGNPLIENNHILNNEGRYGAGIVLNYSGCIIRNNVIASNSGGQTFFGGVAIWITSNLATTPKIIENNTIVNNYSPLLSASGTGGILSWGATNVIIRNNIIWGNLPSQIKAVSSTPSVTFSDVEGGYTGTGNFSSYPQFDLNCYLLDPTSPAVDAGDSAAIYNDNAVANVAVFPSRGTARNDAGAFGGPHALLSGCTPSALNVPGEANGERSLKIFPNPSAGRFNIQGLELNSELSLYDVMGSKVFSKSGTSQEESIDLTNRAEGMYFLVILSGGKMIETKKIIKN